ESEEGGGGEGVGERGGGVEGVGSDHEAPPHGHAETDDEEEAEEIEHGFVEEIEAALEELVVPQGQRDVPVDRRQHRAHEQREEAPEHDGVHDAGVGLRQRARLAERVLGHELHALRDVIEAALGPTGRPEPDVAVKTIDEDRHGDDRAEVERMLCERWNVPERVPERDAGGRHEGSNDITGKIAAAAEYGSRRPATTSSKTALTSPLCSARSTRPRKASTSSASSSVRARSRRRAAKAPLASSAAR